jgi:hypothetical protein
MTDSWTLFHRDRLVELINERRLAAVYDFRAFVTSRGLASSNRHGQALLPLRGGRRAL